MLLATAVVSTVPLFGISQVELTIPQISVQPHQRNTWDGWLDVVHSAHNAGNFADIPGVVAAFATLSNLSASASSICSRPSCSVNAVAAAIQSDCTSVTNKCSNNATPRAGTHVFQIAINVLGELGKRVSYSTNFLRRVNLYQ